MDQVKFLPDVSEFVKDNKDFTECYRKKISLHPVSQTKDEESLSK